MSQAYAANQAEQEKAKSAPAAANSDAGPPREASTYAPPDWAGPPTGYLQAYFCIPAVHFAVCAHSLVT